MSTIVVARAVFFASLLTNLIVVSQDVKYADGLGSQLAELEQTRTVFRVLFVLLVSLGAALFYKWVVEFLENGTWRSWWYRWGIWLVIATIISALAGLMHVENSEFAIIRNLELRHWIPLVTTVGSVAILGIASMRRFN